MERAVKKLVTENEFALVPQPPGAVKKTEPSAKRVLSDMVKDTLALVKKETPAKAVLSVLFGDFQLGYFVDEMLVMELGQRYNLKFIHFRDAVTLLRLSQEEHFDLTVVWLSHVDWGKSADNNFNTSAVAAIELMTRMKMQNGKPILAIGDNQWRSDIYSQQLVQAGAVFLATPFDRKGLRNALAACLNFQHENEETREIPTSLPVRPLRIVIVDDEPVSCEIVEAVIRSWVKEVTVRSIHDGMEAWQELVRDDPDFLIMDINRPGLDGVETLQRLAERKVTYPILVVSGCLSGMEQLARESSGPNLNVRFLSKPFTMEQLWEDLFRRIRQRDHLR